jgi:guanylate kinase
MSQGRLLIIAAPSGAGKTTIVHHILSVFADYFAFSVSAATRPARANEVDGKDYYFISVPEFQAKIADGDFVEYEQVYNNQYYGTLRSEIDRIWANDKNVIFDVDVKGALNIKRKFGDIALTIFVRPPSLEVLEERLRARQTETPESLQKRISKAAYELSFEAQFDKIIINDKLPDALQEAEQIVHHFLQKNI